MNVVLKPTEVEDAPSAQHDHPKNNAGHTTQSFDVTRARIRGHVLVVDDNRCVRETISELLEVVGFHVLQANDAIEAMVILAKAPTIDAMVTDLTMPGDDGIMLIRQARLMKGDMPAILLTGYADQVASISSIAGNSIHVLHKPVESQRLIAQLDRLIQTPPTW